MKPLIGRDRDWEDPATLLDPARSIGLSPAAGQLRIEVEDLIAELSAEGLPAEEAAAIMEAISHAQELFRRSLTDYEAIDIHSIATAEEVRAGTVPISVAFLRRDTPVCHTPATYALHLKSILDHMEQYPNYRAVLLPRGERTHALMVKDGRQALLLRPETPLTVFEVTQPYIAEACREYLMQLIETPFSPAMQRQDTIHALKRMIAKLGAPSDA